MSYHLHVLMRAAFTLMDLCLLMAPVAHAADAKNQFRVAVRLDSTAHVSTSRLQGIRGSTSGPNSSIALRLSGDEHFTFRVEVVEPGVKSVEIHGLGQSTRVGKTPVEITLPNEPNAGTRNVLLTFDVKYHDGIEHQSGRPPIQMTIIP